MGVSTDGGRTLSLGPSGHRLNCIPSKRSVFAQGGQLNCTKPKAKEKKSAVTERECASERAQKRSRTIRRATGGG